MKISDMVNRVNIPEAYPRNPIARLWGGVCPIILMALLCMFLQANGQPPDNARHFKGYQSADNFKQTQIYTTQDSAFDQRPKHKSPYLMADKFRLSYAMAAFPVRTTLRSDGRLSWINYGLQLGFDFRFYRQLFIQFEGSKNFGTNRTYYSQYGLHLGYDIELTQQPKAFLLTPFVGYNFFRYDQRNTGLKGNANYLIGGIRYSLKINRRLSVYASTGLSNLKLRGDPLLYPTDISAAVGFMVKL